MVPINYTPSELNSFVRGVPSGPRVYPNVRRQRIKSHNVNSLFSGIKHLANTCWLDVIASIRQGRPLIDSSRHQVRVAVYGILTSLRIRIIARNNISPIAADLIDAQPFRAPCLPAVVS
jgi:hypothetical protein